jgi:hypothetical protein
VNIEDSDGLAHYFVGVLKRLGIPYMVTGSVALFVYGEPRATNDIDIVIDPSDDALAALLEEIASRTYVSPEAVSDAIRRRSMFNAIDLVTTEKIDFILLKDRPFDAVRFERRVPCGIKSLKFVASSPEDTILSKLSWARRGQSERQLRDVYGVLRIQANSLDWEYLRHWASELSVAPLLDKLLEEIENDKTRQFRDSSATDRKDE